MWDYAGNRYNILESMRTWCTYEGLEDENADVKEDEEYSPGKKNKKKKCKPTPKKPVSKANQGCRKQQTIKSVKRPPNHRQTNCSVARPIEIVDPVLFDVEMKNHSNVGSPHLASPCGSNGTQSVVHLESVQNNNKKDLCKTASPLSGTSPHTTDTTSLIGPSARRQLRSRSLFGENKSEMVPDAKEHEKGEEEKVYSLQNVRNMEPQRKSPKIFRQGEYNAEAVSIVEKTSRNVQQESSEKRKMSMLSYQRQIDRKIVSEYLNPLPSIHMDDSCLPLKKRRTLRKEFRELAVDECNGEMEVDEIVDGEAGKTEPNKEVIAADILSLQKSIEEPSTSGVKKHQVEIRGKSVENHSFSEHTYDDVSTHHNAEISRDPAFQGETVHNLQREQDNENEEELLMIHASSPQPVLLSQEEEDRLLGSHSDSCQVGNSSGDSEDATDQQSKPSEERNCSESYSNRSSVKPRLNDTFQLSQTPSTNERILAFLSE